MESLFAEYNDRNNDILGLISFIELIEKGTTSTTTNNINSIKSSVVLMIYNLIEFVITASIELIEADFRTKNFTDFVEDFQSLFLKTFGIYLNDVTCATINKKIKDENLIGKMLNCFIEYGYFSSNIDLNSKCKIKVINKDRNSMGISGNITFKSIKTISELFNFGGLQTTKEINGNVDLLEDIRNKRNSLAHGNTSFKFIGKDLTIAQLRAYQLNVDKFFRKYLQLVNIYIENKPYLKT